MANSHKWIHLLEQQQKLLSHALLFHEENRKTVMQQNKEKHSKKPLFQFFRASNNSIRFTTEINHECSL